MGNYGNTKEATQKDNNPNVPDQPIPIYKVGNIISRRIKSDHLEEILPTSSFIDVGILNSVEYRNLISADFSAFSNAKVKVSKATMSVYWYFPENTVRPDDTVVEIYRPAAWDTNSVTWLKNNVNSKWRVPGVDWSDAKGVIGGTTPYAATYLDKNKLPDNAYITFDLTGLIQAYINGTLPNTGFLIKTRPATNNYIAFYSNTPALPENKKIRIDVKYM